MKMWLCTIAAALALITVPVRAADESPAAPTHVVSIVVDRGIAADTSETLKKQLDQIGELMNVEFPRIVARFAKQGFKGEMLASADDFKPGEGNYLLKVKITKYNAGNKAARMIVGFGAGGASLDCSYELSADGKTALVSSQTGSFSGRDWRNSVRKVEEIIIQAVVDHAAKK